MLIYRKKTRAIKIGDVGIGGDYPVSVQSMTNTKTADIAATVSQINELQAAGCEIVRVAVPDLISAQAIRIISKEVQLPLIADIHFDYKLALEAINSGVAGLRLNPGNIGDQDKVRMVASAAKDQGVPIRIGVNCGSVSKEKIEKYGLTPEALVESALEHIAILERVGFYDIKVSVKGSSVPFTIDAYRLLSSKVDYPLHVGITEAGTLARGTVTSAVGIGILLSEGIGDTIRVSLTAPPVEEIPVAIAILKSLGLRKGLEIISCPTCGRTEIDIICMAQRVERELAGFRNRHLTVAVMGCIVNGPGEASAADFGIAGGKKKGVIFRKGEIAATVPEEKLVEVLVKMIKEHLGSDE